MSLIKAIQFAELAHRTMHYDDKGNQVMHVRKYTGDPYLVHLLEVGKILEDYHAPGIVVTAGILHDVLEDTAVTYLDVWKEFGQVVASIVGEMTEGYTKKMFPELNRKTRKELEALRLSRVSMDAKSVKCADLISNMRSILLHDKNFATVYLDEVKRLVPVLSGAYPLLHQHLTETVASAAVS